MLSNAISLYYLQLVIPTFIYSLQLTDIMSYDSLSTNENNLLKCYYTQYNISFATKTSSEHTNYHKH